LHWTKVDGLERSDGVLAEYSIDVNVDWEWLMDVLALSLKDVEDDIRSLGACLHLNLPLTEESDDDSLFLLRLEFVLLWLNSEDLSSELLLPGEVVRNWVLALVLDGDGILLRFSNSDCAKVKHLGVFLADGHGWGDLECLSLDLNYFGLLLNSASLSVFYLKCDIWLETVLFLGLEDDLDDLLLAGLQCTTGVRDLELLR